MSIIVYCDFRNSILSSMMCECSNFELYINTVLPWKMSRGFVKEKGKQYRVKWKSVFVYSDTYGDYRFAKICFIKACFILHFKYFVIQNNDRHLFC